MALNREGWLTAVSEKLVPRLEDISGLKMPNFNISVGFPSQRALASKGRRIGECWNKVVCTNGTFQIFVSPLINGGDIDVTGVVAHELAHALVGTKHGHKRPFTQVIRPLGLIGKATATEVGPVFREIAEKILAKVGEYPHAPMTINKAYKPQATRMLKAECACEYKVRITATWLNDPEYGAPICPKCMTVMDVA